MNFKIQKVVCLCISSHISSKRAHSTTSSNDFHNHTLKLTENPEHNIKAYEWLYFIPNFFKFIVAMVSILPT